MAHPVDRGDELISFVGGLCISVISLATVAKARLPHSL